MTDRENSLLQGFVLVIITVGLASVHGIFFWIFASLTALLWLRFLGSQLVRARRRWLIQEREGFPPEYEVADRGVRTVSRKRLVLTGLEFTAMALSSLIVSSVFVARILRDGPTAGHVLALMVLLPSVVLFGNLTVIWWETFFANRTEPDEILRRRMADTSPSSLLDRFDEWTNRSD